MDQFDATIKRRQSIYSHPCPLQVLVLSAPLLPSSVQCHPSPLDGSLTMTSWYRLSPELRNMILGTVAECHSYRTEPKALSGYASVSREWNCFFETTNFQRVSLDRGRAQDFDKMFSGENTRRRGYLKYLQVLFVFEEYDCSSCATPEDDATRKR